MSLTTPYHSRYDAEELTRRNASDSMAKPALRRAVKDLETDRAKQRRTHYQAQDEIDARKEELISGVEARLRASTRTGDVLTIAWELV